MKTNCLRNTVRISASPGSSHFIVHLANIRNPKVSPCFKKMLAQRDGLFIGKLTRPGCMSCNINRVKRIKSGNLIQTSEISRSHKIGLVEISHFLCLNVRIGLFFTIFPLFSFVTRSPMPRKNSCKLAVPDAKIIFGADTPRHIKENLE